MAEEGGPRNLGPEIEAQNDRGRGGREIFFSKGIITGVLGTGMTDMHTVGSRFALSDDAKNHGAGPRNRSASHGLWSEAILTDIFPSI